MTIEDLIDQARRAITLDDIEYWLVMLGASYEQGSDDSANSIARLETLRDLLKALDKC